MSDLFFERPILNSTYAYPRQHWELDDTGQPTQKVIEARRLAKYVTPPATLAAPQVQRNPSLFLPA